MWNFCTADGYQSLFCICLVPSKNKKNCGEVMQRKLAAWMINQPAPEDALKKSLYHMVYAKAIYNICKYKYICYM